ncbi:hypothetical protein KG091_07760 [Carnobacteriaceae bacterium zg-ZUI78]|nr:hypothetical protein [Carnobacteriaceae bacterium zg-ZUI78]
MGHLRGTTVILMDKIENGKDPFGKAIYQDKEVKVENVLISPTSSEDVINQLNLTGKKAVYTLGIPKGDTHQWEDKEVRFFNRRWRVFGIPLEGIEEMIPLDWNKKVMVEKYE